MKKNIMLVILIVGSLAVIISLIVVREYFCAERGQYVGMNNYNDMKKLTEPDRSINEFVLSEKKECIERTSLGRAFLSLFPD